MTALERIEKFECTDLREMSPGEVFRESSHLLKAFKVMREMAIGYQTAYFETRKYPIKPGVDALDELFDQRMKE